MKLLYLHNTSLDSEKANIIQVLYMCDCFSRLGVDITLAVPTGNKYFSESDAVEDVARIVGKRPTFPIKCFPSYAWGKRFKGIGAYYAVKTLLREYRDVDVCFVRSIFLARLALAQGFKVIYESHGSVLNTWCKLLNCAYTRSLLRDASHEKLLLFIAISQELGKIWKQRGVPANKILTLHDGVSAEDFESIKSREDARKSLGITFNGKIVAYAGSLYRDRSIENVLRLAETFRDVLFYVVGGPENQKKLYESKAEQVGLTNIVFEGHVSHKMVKDYLFAADVLLMLWSRSTPTINICSPLKVFEYAAAGRIIVGYGFPTIKEVLMDGQTAILAEPDSYPDLERKVDYALSLDYPNDMAQNARYLALHNYSWEIRAKTIVKALHLTA